MEKVNLIITNTIFLSFIILPVSLVSGPLISDFLISLTTIIFIFYCIKNKEYKYFKNKFFLILFIFYIWSFACSMLSEFKLISSLKSIVYFRFFIFALATWFIFEKKKNVIKYSFFSIFACFCILVADGYFQYFTGESITGSNNPLRISSFFGDELIYGSYLSRFLPVLTALFFLTKYSKLKKNQIFFSIFIIITSVIIYLSGERAAFLFVLFTFLYLIVMLNKYSKHIIILFSIILTSVGVFSLNNEKISDRMIKRTLEQAGISKGISNFSSHHKGHYLVAWDLFKNNKIFGVGPKNFQKECINNKKYQSNPYICTNHPHNTYLQLLSETGIVGFIIISYLFFYLCYVSLKHIYNKILGLPDFMDFPFICILSAILITLWPLIPTGSFFNNYINIIYYFPIGILLWLQNNKSENLIKPI